MNLKEQEFFSELSKRISKDKIILREDNMKTFWMVYVENRESPTYKHETSESAKTEAERLARQSGNKDRNVYVLRAENVCNVAPPEPPITWKHLG